MVSTSLHRERLVNPDTQVRKIGEGFAALRGEHLKRLGPLEELVRSKAPLAISYDTSRMQPPYFHEFTFTEIMGALFVSPHSSEIGARLVAHAAESARDDRFEVAAHLSFRDKYDLVGAETRQFSRVAFLPGTNVFAHAVSREGLDRAMHNHPDLLLKPHPLTSENTIRQLGISYGYERMLEPKSSGWAILRNTEIVYTPSSSEMGLYAVLLGKRIQNITTFGFEAKAPYNAFYRLLWEKEPGEAKRVLTHVLNSPFSGVFHPNDPNVSEKIDTYFAKAMALREPFKPLVREYDAFAYGALVNPHARRQENAESPDQREQ